MQSPPNHFSLFGLACDFSVDKAQLERAYRQAQRQVHPDRFAAASAAEQRQALQWATWVNEAYQTLKHPLARARYLLSLHAIECDAQSNTAMTPAFLMQQMTWRESLADALAARDHVALEHLSHTVQTAYQHGLAQLSSAFADQRYPTAADVLRQLYFLDKLDHEITDSLADLLA